MADAVAVPPDTDRELLTRAYDLLDAALPLALQQLRTGPVDLHDQRYFWQALVAMEDWLADEVIAGYFAQDGETVECSFADLAARRRRHDG